MEKRIRIAVLLSGRTRNVEHTTQRIISNFNSSGVDVDFFAHTWDDDFSFTNEEYDNELLSSGGVLSSEFLRGSLVQYSPAMSDIKYFSPKKYCITSYNEIIDEHETMRSSISMANSMLTIGYLAQTASFDHAARCLRQYVKDTGTHYNYVLKWRYDLVTDTIHPNSFIPWLKNINDGEMYFQSVGTSSLTDTWFASTMNTAGWAFRHINPEFKRAFRDRMSTNHPDYQVFECNLRAAIDRIKVKPLSINRPPFVTAIFREGCNPDDPVGVIHDFNVSDWINIGWEQLVIKDDHGITRI